MRRGTLLLAAVIGGCWLAAATPAAHAVQQCVLDGNCCKGLCGAATCYSECVDPNNVSTTCWEWQGRFSSDIDGDGIANASDNCACTANANQANCDGDPWGDACDSANVKWVFTQDRNATCYIDKDEHFPYFTLERYSSELWTNVCGAGGTCINHVFEQDADCFSLPTYKCCTDVLGRSTTECNAYLQKDKCGTPHCPF